MLLRTQLFLRIRYFLLGSFPCWLESLHTLVTPGESGIDPTDPQTGNSMSAKGTLVVGSQQHKQMHWSKALEPYPCTAAAMTQPSLISTLTVLGLTSWLTGACLVVKHTVLSSQPVFLLVFEVANIGRQSFFLHSTYHWISQLFVLPVGFFGWEDAKCKLHWTALRSKIQFHIFRGDKLCKVFFPTHIILIKR